MSKPSNRSVYIAGILATVVVAGFWYCWLNFPLSARGASYSAAEAGQIGDKFGALNTLFTGLALVGLFVTIMVERRERSQSESHTLLALKHAESAAEAASRQVRLAAETARLQALPVLINLQRDRIAAVGAGVCSGVDTHYLFERWVEENLAFVLKTIEEYPEKLRKAMSPDEQPKLPGAVVRPRSKEDQDRLVRAIQQRFKAAEATKPELELLLAHLKDFRDLYSSMADFATPNSELKVAERS